MTASTIKYTELGPARIIASEVVQRSPITMNQHLETPLLMQKIVS